MGFKKMSQEAKDKYLAHYKKEAGIFAQLPKETQEKAAQMMMNPEFSGKKMENHNAFFAKADANKDGMLSLEEYMVYAKLWTDLLNSYGVDYPSNPDFDKEAWEAYKVSGKEGVTNDDLLQTRRLSSAPQWPSSSRPPARRQRRSSW